MSRLEKEKKGSHTKLEWENKKKEFDYCCCICGIPEDLIKHKILSENKSKIKELNSLKREKQKKLNQKTFFKNFKKDLEKNLLYYSKLEENFPKALKKQINITKKYLHEKDLAPEDLMEKYNEENIFPFEIQSDFSDSVYDYLRIISEIKKIERDIEKTQKAYFKPHYQKLQKDHIKEVQELGYVWNDIENIQPTCVFCNYRKGADTRLQLYLRQNEELIKIIKNLKLKTGLNL